MKKNFNKKKKLIPSKDNEINKNKRRRIACPNERHNKKNKELRPQGKLYASWSTLKDRKGAYREERKVGPS